MGLVEPYEELELEFMNWTGIPHGFPVACSSGTAALHLALEACQFPPGSQVIIPEFTMVACARAVIAAGLKPVFVDCNDDLLINPDLIKHAITDQTVAIMAVHIYGRYCEMNTLMDFCTQHDLVLIEDCAEAHVPIMAGRSHIACWSFYKNKIIHGEEGGLVMFLEEDKAMIARSLRSLGFTEDHDFMHIPRGMNYRMSNAHAKLILENLAEADENITRRCILENLFEQAAEDLKINRMPHRDVPWVYDLLLPRPSRELMNRVVFTLNELGIPARHGFKPMSMMPEFIGHYRHLNAYTCSQAVMYLPINPDMEDKDVMSWMQAFKRESERV